MVAADIDPYEQEIMQLRKQLKDVEGHRDGLSLALKDLRKAVIQVIPRFPSSIDVYKTLREVLDVTEYNGCCTSCGRCLCIDAHPGCSCVDCGGTGYYKGRK